MALVTIIVQEHRLYYHTLGTHCQFGSILPSPPYSKNTKRTHIWIEDCSRERFEKVGYLGNQVNKCVSSLLKVQFKIDLSVFANTVFIHSCFSAEVCTIWFQVSLCSNNEIIPIPLILIQMVVCYRTPLLSDNALFKIGKLIKCYSSAAHFQQTLSA